MKALAPRVAPALAALGMCAALLAVARPASAEEAGPRRVALVLDPPPAADEVRTKMAQAAALTLMGLAGTREQDLVSWAVLRPGEAPVPQTLGDALGEVGAWQQSKGRKARPELEAADAWVGARGVVVHIGPGARADGGRLALAVGAGTSVVEAVAPVLEDIWRPDPRVRVRGPSKRIDPLDGAAQQTVISLQSARPNGVDDVLGTWDEGVERIVWAWYRRAPGLSTIQADEPVIAVMTTADVRVESCPTLEGGRARYSIWPAGTAEKGLRFRLTGPRLARPVVVDGRDGFVQHETPLLGAVTIAPLFSAAKGDDERLLPAGAERRCEVWPALVATPRIDVQEGGGDARIRVTFVDPGGAVMPAARVLEVGPLSVRAIRGVSGDAESVPLGVDGEHAFAPLPAADGQTLTLQIDPEESGQRLLGSATATVLPPDGGGPAPWLVGLLAAIVAAVLAVGWPWFSTWLVERLPGGGAPSGELTVEVDDRVLDRQLLDGETLYPLLAGIMRPVPLGTHEGAPKLVRLELVRGLRGVRVVAFIAEEGRVRIRSRPLTAATPWQCDGLTVRFSG